MEQVERASEGRRSSRPRALLVGCSNFDSRLLAPLHGLSTDLAALASALGGENVDVLENPSRQAAISALTDFLSSPAAEFPFSMLVLSSHGRASPDGRVLLAMSDTVPETFEQTALAVSDVIELAQQSDRPVLLVIESSYSGLAAEALTRSASRDPKMHPQRSALAILASSGGLEQSVELAHEGGFLMLLARGIWTAAGDLSGRRRQIGLQELFDYLVREMAALRLDQRPYLALSGDQSSLSSFMFDSPRFSDPATAEVEASQTRRTDQTMATPTEAPAESRSIGVSASGEVISENAPLKASSTNVEDDAASRFDLDQGARTLMAWVDVIRKGAGRDHGDPLDVVIGALAGLRVALSNRGKADPRLLAMLKSLESPDRAINQILRDALAPYALPKRADTNASPLPMHAPVLALASSIAEQTTGTRRISQTHLLAAALVTRELPPELVAALGCDRADLCGRLLTAVSSSPTGGDPQAWAQLLGPAELLAPFASDYVPSRGRRSGGLHAPELADHLEVDVYVTMLAAMIARTSTAMPVSVGLFGEWGSGKTYFMELLRQKVQQLSETVAADGVSGPYCKEIIQVTFNAWSYADTNLWASLAADFFGQLATPETDPDDARRARIRESLKEKNQLRRELESARETAVERTKMAYQEYADAVAAREQQARTFDARLARAVLADSAVKERLHELGKSVPGQSAERALQIADDVAAITSDIAATRRILGVRSLRWPFYLSLVAIAAVVAAVVLPNGPLHWLLSGGALATVVALLASVGVAVARSRRSVGQFRALAEAVAQARAHIASDTDRSELSELASELRRAEAEEAVARISLKELDEAIARLDRQLTDYEPGRRLYQFIAERAASLDYRGQLGVVSLVRRDFEQLVELMREWREEPNGDSDESKPIDRIVLYIDDLDRCEPEQVVQVLQAVHLLLAMDLFVVVVGVDPRWLLRSLRTRYSGVLRSDGEAGHDGALGFAASTPKDYVEKIFQIPFVLPPMSSGGFRGLLRSFLPSERAGTLGGAPGSAVSLGGDPGGVGLEVVPQGADKQEVDSRASGAETVSRAAPLVAEDHSEIAEVSGLTATESGTVLAPIVATPITKRELDLLDLLSPLVRTPRAATRMFNIYGLLRSARDLSPGSRFLGTRDEPGDYQAVIQLLGVLTSAPALLGVMLWGAPGDESLGLCRSTGPSSWRDFVISLTPEQDESRNGWFNAVATQISADDVENWQRLVADLRDIGRHVPLDDIERYRVWGPQVARFSFELSSIGS